jgi:hypothetical protein
VLSDTHEFTREDNVVQATLQSTLLKQPFIVLHEVE